jgi:hypothetical protein
LVNKRNSINEAMLAAEKKEESMRYGFSPAATNVDFSCLLHDEVLSLLHHEGFDRCCAKGRESLTQTKNKRNKCDNSV